MSPIDPHDWLAKHPDVESITFALCDINGVMRGKRVPIAKLDSGLNGGLRIPISACTLDIWGHDIEDSELVFEAGDSDGRCTVTERGLIPRTWGTHPSAFFQVTMTGEDGTPVPTDPRHALAAVVKRFKDKGLTPVVATELEFYLTTVVGGIPQFPTLPNGHAPLEGGNVLSISDVDAMSAFLDDVYVACRALDIPADAAISEGGVGQFEINLLHSNDPLKAADDAVLFKNLVKDIARKHGYCATFMAKPYGDQPGNGFHVHFSLLDAEGRNIFDDGTETGSDALQFAVAGLLDAMQDSTLIFAPHLNSYRRIRPGSHAPTGVAWGYENRTCAVRIPGGPNVARRIEHRVAGADANPYLVLAAVLGAALSGMDAAQKPVGPLQGNAYEAELPKLPLDWIAAMEAFSNSTVMPRILHPQLVRLFGQAKQQELQKFLDQVSQAEYRAYLETV